MNETGKRGFVSTDDNFGSSLRKARESVGLTQNELADAMRSRGFDFVQQTIYKIESGRRRVSVGEAVAFADILDIPLQVLAESDPESVQAHKTRLEWRAGEYLRLLIELEEDIREQRNMLEQIRQDVREFDELASENEGWEVNGIHHSAYSFFSSILEFTDLDGLQWAWDEWRTSGSARHLLRHFKLIPASELPIEGYEDDGDD